MNKIGIIGLGYVGLPLAIAASKKYYVYGYDNNLKRIDELKRGIDKNNEFFKKDFNKLNTLFFTNKISDLYDCNYKIITVPTPIKKNKQPDLRILINATIKISKYIKKNDFIIYESTVYPGVTEKICIPLIQKNTGFKLNKEFYCGYSPERINPGDRLNNILNVNKITSGSNQFALNKIDKFYQSIIKAKTFKANSIMHAEAAKVIENAQRDINIAFINEVSQIFNKLNLNTYEVLKAASTKWNFLKFEPGFVGGHCIGVDPYYLSYVAKKLKIKPNIILSGRKINDSMPILTAKKLLKQLSKKKSFKRSKILLLGFSFKENVKDYRNTKVFDFYKYLKNKIDIIDLYDPIIDRHLVKKELNLNFLKKLKFNHSYDAVCILVKHKEFINLGKKNILMLGNKNCIYFDLKNIFKDKRFITL